MQTLNGNVTVSDEDPLKFMFTSEDGHMYTFKASSGPARDHWVKDIKAIHTTQDQMKKGKLIELAATNNYYLSLVLPHHLYYMVVRSWFRRFYEVAKLRVQL